MIPKVGAVVAVAVLLAMIADAALAERQGETRSSKAVSLDYVVSLETPEEQRVAVMLEIRGLDTAVAALHVSMPQRFAFIRLPEPLLGGPIRATAGATPLGVKRRGPYEWEVLTAGQETIRLSYEVPLTHRSAEGVRGRDAYEYPYVAEDHGLLVTPTMFVIPDELPFEHVGVRFDLPEGWRVIAPWPQGADGAFEPASRAALVDDLIAIGAWHVHTIRVGAFEGTIAFAPGQDALEQAAVEPIRRIVAYELELFGRPAAGRYLFLFGRPEIAGMAGSPKTRSMTLSVESRLAPAASQYLPHLIAHEFFHTWAGGMEMPDELRWVNEGFTDYYAYLVSARLGLDTWEQFATTLGEKMRNCASNPRRGKLSLADSGGEVFFHDDGARDLVYEGGLLVAAWLDRTIRGQGRGQTLDDLMRTFNNDPRWTANDAAPSLEDFLVVAERYTNRATAKVLERFVRRPYDFDPVVEFGKLGVSVRHERRPPEMALRANLDGTRVVNLDRNWVTYQVGVRGGDRFVEVNGQKVTDGSEVRSAWRKPRENRIRVTLERDGRHVSIDEPVPRIEAFVVSAEPWREGATCGDMSGD